MYKAFNEFIINIETINHNKSGRSQMVIFPDYRSVANLQIGQADLMPFNIGSFKNMVALHMGEKACDGIDRVSDYTVEDTKKVVKFE